MRPDNLTKNPKERALLRLDYMIDHLCRLHDRQFYVRYLSDALFWGLLISAIAVLVIRLTLPGYPVWSGIALPVTLAVLGGALIAWRRRQEKLSVAIEADQKLKLKQQLSTAFEYRQSQPDSDVTRALAFQVAGRRHSTMTGIFPFKLNLPGMLVPLALAAIVLSSTVNLQRAEPPPSAEVDTLLMDEGRRLKAFARRMQHRAIQQAYPRSQTVAQNLQRLGTNMESGALERGQALTRLETMEHDIASRRSEALGDAANVGENSEGAESGTNLQDSPHNRESQDWSGMRNRLSSGDLSSEDMRALDQASETLTELGISEEQLRQALDQYASGDSQKLKQILDTLTNTDRHRGDARELAKARTAVAQARENLSDDEPNESNISSHSDVMVSDTDSEDGVSDGYGLGEFPGQTEDGGSWTQMNSPDNSPNEDPSSPSELSDDARVTIEIKGQKRAGGSFTSSTWALPRVGSPTEQRVEVDARFNKQLESVLTKENYPLHRKELVRRYFLNLSTGTQGDTGTGAKNK